MIPKPAKITEVCLNYTHDPKPVLQVSIEYFSVFPRSNGHSTKKILISVFFVSTYCKTNIMPTQKNVENLNFSKAVLNTG